METKYFIFYETKSLGFGIEFVDRVNAMKLCDDENNGIIVCKLDLPSKTKVVFIQDLKYANVKSYKINTILFSLKRTPTHFFRLEIENVETMFF